jgi:hypothetical protein
MDRWALALLLALTACGGEPRFGYRYEELTLSELAAQSGCTTAGTEGIANQLVDEMLCLSDGRLERFTPHDGVRLASSRVHPYLSPAGRSALWDVASPSRTVSITSALRTIAEQYVLYLNCRVAASPGRSNHETGRAIDVSNHGEVGAALVSAGFTHPLPATDPVHYEASGPDLRTLSVLAFQRLWNKNHPGDLILEDGIVGTQTLSRLARAPAGGFEVGRVCGVVETPELSAQFVAQSFPLAQRGVVELAPGEEREGWIELKNTGRTTWVPGTTMLGTTVPRDRLSPVRASGWPSGRRAATIDGRVAPGATGRFVFAVRGPDTPGDYDEHFGTLHEGVGWFGDAGQGGPPDDRLRIRVRVGVPRFAARLVGSTFPDPAGLAPGGVIEGTFELENRGTETWRPGEVFLATTEPRDRPSDFADGWPAPNRAASVEQVVQPGQVGRFTFRLRAPHELGRFDERFGLVREGVAWFGDDQQGGPDDDTLLVRGVIAIEVPRPTPTGPLPRLPGGGPAPGASGGGGCSAAPGAAALAAMWVLLALLVRRRTPSRPSGSLDP